MEDQRQAQPFDTIESAEEFVSLLHICISESLDNVHCDLCAALSEKMPRRAEALEVVTLKLKQLDSHVAATERLLKDLHTLRDLLVSGPKENSLKRDDEPRARASSSLNVPTAEETAPSPRM